MLSKHLPFAALMVIGLWAGGPALGAPARTESRIGVMRLGLWLVDWNGDGQWNPSVGAPKDQEIVIGQASDLAVVGDWNGSGTQKAGIFRGGLWIRDLNGNGRWDGPTEEPTVTLGGVGDTPVVGDWNGDGREKVGVYHQGFWLLDKNGNGQWEGPPQDEFIALGGQSQDIPVVGDWNGDGRTKVGIFRNGAWYLDTNGDGQYTAADQGFILGQAGDIPVLGDWNGDGKTKVGVFRNGLWLLDQNGDQQTIQQINFGQAGDSPMPGHWDHSPITRVGIYRAGTWQLDSKGSGHMIAGDLIGTLGRAGDLPLVFNASGIPQPSGFPTVPDHRVGINYVAFHTPAATALRSRLNLEQSLGTQGLPITASPLTLENLLNQTPGINNPPQVSACLYAGSPCPRQTAVRQTELPLNGTAWDDGLPLMSKLSTTWSKVSFQGTGAGDVRFADPSARFTTALFSDPGNYLLRLTATDGALQSVSELSVLVSGDSTVPTAARLVLTAASSANAAMSGDLLVFTINYQNVGGGTASNVTITDGIPVGSTIVGGSISNGGTVDHSVVTWKLPSIPSGSSGSVRFQVRVD